MYLFIGLMAHPKQIVWDYIVSMFVLFCISLTPLFQPCRYAQAKFDLYFNPDIPIFFLELNRASYI